MPAYAHFFVPLLILLFILQSIVSFNRLGYGLNLILVAF